MQGFTIHSNRPNAPYHAKSPTKNSKNAGAPRNEPAGPRATDSFQWEHVGYRETQLQLSDSRGGAVNLSVKSMEYKHVSGSTRISGKGGAEVFHRIREETLRIQQIMVSRLLVDAGGQPREVEKGSEDELQIPEEWNAENTSGRIVDFALGLRGAFEGNDAEFLKIVKGAVEDGFEQAREILGALPDKVQGLMDDTYSLVMEKLDRWIAEREESSESAESEIPISSESTETEGVNLTA